MRAGVAAKGAQVNAQAVGRRIKDRRLAAGLSQAELGGQRFSASYISHIESGRRTANAEVLDYLASRLGVGSEELDAGRDARYIPLGFVEAITSAQDHALSGEWSMAAREAERAALVADNSGHADRAWEARYLRALALLEDSQYAEAARVWSELAEQGPALRSVSLACQCHAYASRGYRAAGKLLDARREAETALAITATEPVEDKALVSALLAQISASGAAGDLPAATEAAERVRGNLNQVEGQLRAVALWNLGVIEMRSGDMQRGIELLEEARTHLHPTADLRAWGRLHRVLGHYLIAVGRIDEGAERLATAADVLKVAGNAADLRELHLSEALLAQHRGDWVRAEALVRHCMDDETCDSPADLAEALGQLVDILIALDRTAEAREALRDLAAAHESADLLAKAVADWRRYAELEATEKKS